MFSGIIEELGQVKRISKSGGVTLLEILADKVLEGTGVGESVCVNGVCLTVIKNELQGLVFEVIPQTLKNTNLGILKIREKVNLERSLKIGDRLSGHFVTGHVDCIGIIRKKQYLSGNLGFEIAVPVQFVPYLLDKGSVAVDGISLTVASKRSHTFTVYIIPHTQKNTTLGFKGPGNKVNIEFDILSKSAGRSEESAFNFL